MPKQGAKLAVLAPRARASRLLLVLAALVFLLNAADPTPRFLGIRRAAWFGQPAESPAQVHHVLPIFVLPPAVKPTSDGSHHACAQAELAPGPAPCASFLPPVDAQAALAPPLFARAPAPGRTGSISPLRC